MPFDRNKNDKSTATKPDVLHVANIKPDTVKDRGFWWNLPYLLAGVINIPKNSSNHDQHNGVRPDVIKSRFNQTRRYFVVQFDRYAIDFPYGNAAIVRGDFKFISVGHCSVYWTTGITDEKYRCWYLKIDLKKIIKESD